MSYQWVSKAGKIRRTAKEWNEEGKKKGWKGWKNVGSLINETDAISCRSPYGHDTSWPLEKGKREKSEINQKK